MEGLAQTLVSNVGNLVGEEFRQLRAVGGQVSELMDELAAMNAIIRMHSEADDDGGAIDHFVREWMKQVRELAYDAEDCIHLYIFRIRCRRGLGVVVWCKRQIRTLFSRHRLAGEITALNARAVAISERHARYGVSRDALRRTPSLASAGPAAAATSEYALRPADSADHFVGISEQVNTLANNLRAPGMALTVFCVVGFGGLGKTTLAMEVCRQLEADFQRHAQVSVSQAFDCKKDLKELLKQVLRQIAKVKTKEDDNNIMQQQDASLTGIDAFNVDQLAELLDKNLLDKRYLIVVDDVWTVQVWEAIHFRLPRSNCGSRIIVTTRMESVAKAASHSEDRCIHRMEPLGIAASKKLFVNRVFGTEGTLPCELESITDSILGKCSGLPLAIVSIASLLAGYKSNGRLQKWERVCSSIGSEMESNPTLEGMRQLITLSYNYLPHRLKVCMMYLSIFPEDYEIPKIMLLYKWMAEGLIAEKRGLTLIEVAEEYFSELVSRNMIQPAHVNFDGSVTTCRVHDMMLEVLVSKSLEANFVSLVGRQFIGVPYGKIRRLSVHDDEWGPNEEEEVTNDYESPSKQTGKGPCVRRGVEEIALEHARSLVIFKSQDSHLLDRLGEFKLLRVLNLEKCKVLKDYHMKYVCRMYLLRFLSLSGTNITVIPPLIGDLEHLQVLNVFGTLLSGLPETVTKLAKLERLIFGNKEEWRTVWRPRRGLSKMKALRKVYSMRLDENHEIAREIGQLQQLEELCLLVSCSVSTVLSQLGKSLSKVRSLRSLNIGAIWYSGPALDFLLEMSPSPSLQYLRIAGGISQLPDWVRSLTSLANISIAGACLVGDQLYDVLCKLPNLKTMIIEKDGYSGTELVARSKHTFPALTYLALAEYECPKIVQFEQGSMAKLEMFGIGFAGMERSILGIEHLTSLKDVHISGKEDNSSLDCALKQLKSESDSRSEPKQFKVTVRYI